MKVRGMKGIEQDWIAYYDMHWVVDKKLFPTFMWLKWFQHSVTDL